MTEAVAADLNIIDTVDERKSEEIIAILALINRGECVQSDQLETTKRKREENNDTETISSAIVPLDHAQEIQSVDSAPVVNNANSNEEGQSAEPAKKKKKQFVGKTNFVNNDEFEDILETGWFYLDSYEKPQGPFSSREMKQWYFAGFFFETTMVKRINEEEFVPISDCEEFKHYDLSSTIVSTDIYSMDAAASTEQKQDYYGEEQYGHNYNHYESAYHQPSVSSNYAQSAYFNSHNGRFAPVASHFAAKGIPEDKAGRMLSHYLDMDSYQESMRAAKSSEQEVGGKIKVTKKMVSAFKKKKVDKQRRRILMM
jgi:hypothetical protein